MYAQSRSISNVISVFAGGDYARYYPPLCADGSSAVFHALNRGKKSVMMDLKKKDEREQFLKLLATADVLVESFRPGATDERAI